MSFSRSHLGILVAILGNTVISLALNLQKLAHANLEHARASTPTRKVATHTSSEIPSPLSPTTSASEPESSSSDARSAATDETPLLHLEVVAEESDGSPEKGDKGNEGDYLKSKLWWLGFILMNVGEIGNFIAYSFSPASIIAPLGTTALIMNCLFAPILLGERFHKRDLLGITIAIIGAITVVLATNSSDVRLDPSSLLRAISQRPFIVYSAVYVVGAIFLTALSQGNAGKQWVFVDLGLCALYGGFTVLSTKAVSSLLTLQWVEIFTEWITYPVLFILVLTGVCQVRYLNKALMRFDSKVVIPTQFVLFNVSAIVGSAILYGDFAASTFHQLVTFCYGCAATFLGVFIIAWTPSDSDDDDQESDHDNNGTENVPNSAGNPPAQKSTPRAAAAPRLLRKRTSAVSLIGVSAAQYLLMAHSPSREITRGREWDVERDMNASPNNRRRNTSFFAPNASERSHGPRASSVGRRIAPRSNGSNPQ